MSRLLEQALELPPTARANWLHALPVEHAELKATLQQLLQRAASDETNAFLRTLPKLDRGATAASTERAEGEQIGPYRLLRPLGKGGMGTVWLAERADGALKRQVALKLPLIAGQPLMRDRLLKERDLLAALEHPNIARLYDAGIDSAGQPYLALEYVDGQPVDLYCRTSALDVKAKLAVFLQVARAVAYAHAHLTLHRDLKPSNILVTADGQVRLLDFGVAKMLENGGADETELTQLHGRALTPSYASPEQILGQTLSVASDVYSLGVVLFEMLTGHLPYRLKRDSRGALEDAIVTVDAIAPSSAVSDRTLRRALLGDLDTIVLKALKKAPPERYPTVAALAEDVERHLSGRPVLARPDSAAYRVSKFVSRHKFAVGSATAIVLALAGSAEIARRQAVYATEQARQAQQQSTRAAAVQTFLTDVFLASTYGQPDPQKAQNTTARELLLTGAKRIESSLDDAPEAKAEVLHTLGNLMKEFGLNDDAVALHRRRVAILRTLHQPVDVRIADALIELVAAMDESSVRNERDTVVDEAQRILDAQGDTASLSRAELLLRHAELLQYRDWEGSARQARKAATLFQLHNTSAKRADALSLEAEAEYRMGNNEAAERNYQASVDIARTLPAGRNHQLLANVQINLAQVQGQRLKVADADRNFREAIETTESVYGRDHEVFVKNTFLYGMFLERYAQGHKAIPMLRQAAEAAERMNGDDKTYLKSIIATGLGIALVDYGLPEEGLRAIARADVLSRALASPDLNFAQGLQTAARAAAESGDLALAKARLDEASAITARHDPAASRELANRNQVQRARIALYAGRPAEAVDWLKKAGVYDQTNVPLTRFDVLDRLLVAEVRLASGEFDGAGSAAQQVRTAIDQLGLSDAASRELARLDIVDGRLRLRAADARAATAFFQRALNARQRVLDPQSPLVAEALIYLAQARLAAGDSMEAKRLQREARSVLALHAGTASRFAALLP